MPWNKNKSWFLWGTCFCLKIIKLSWKVPNIPNIRQKQILTVRMGVVRLQSMFCLKWILHRFFSMQCYIKLNWLLKSVVKGREKSRLSLGRKQKSMLLLEIEHDKLIIIFSEAVWGRKNLQWYQIKKYLRFSKLLLLSATFLCESTSSFKRTAWHFFGRNEKGLCCVKTKKSK